MTDPSAVVISATGASSRVYDNGSDDFDGVSLLNIFNSDYSFDFDVPTYEVAGTLAARNGTAYADVYNPYKGFFAANEDFRSLNLYHYDDPDKKQRFRTDEAAFTGMATLDLSGAQFSVGTVGDVITGYELNYGVVIGQYEIVTTPIPEPVAAVGGTALCGLVALRRRRV